MDIIPIWWTVPSKRNEENVEYRRSRTHGYRRFIPSKDVKWKQFVHPSEYGTLADVGDYMMYGHLTAEFSMPRYYRAANFEPPTWLYHITKTRVGMVPPKICSRLPMIDLTRTKMANSDHLRRHFLFLIRLCWKLVKMTWLMLKF